MKLFQENCMLNMIVVAKWEDSEKDLYYGFKSVKWNDFFRITPRDASNFHPFSKTNTGFPNGRMMTACEEFIHRMGWEIKHSDEEDGREVRRARIVSESGSEEDSDDGHTGWGY